jgi:predicted TIM-barrel fold metal-dependent hydrolase
MHMGYPYLHEMKSILLVYPQVYSDISVIDWVLPKEQFYQYFQVMIVAAMPKK